MAKIRSFEDLDVWQIGKELVLKIYELTSHFPREEVYRMTSQVKRAALSVPANISEGFGRFHFMDKAKFYLNARGSLYELKSHLLLANELGFIEDRAADGVFQIIDELSLKMNNLINRTRNLNQSQ
ncbi:MAG: four helix bundle protein [Nitrospirae bacterium]|nr:four helix bundle protein [Nitrospirota bacterium]